MIPDHGWKEHDKFMSWLDKENEDADWFRTISTHIRSANNREVLSVEANVVAGIKAMQVDTQVLIDKALVGE